MYRNLVSKNWNGLGQSLTVYDVIVTKIAWNGFHIGKPDA